MVCVINYFVTRLMNIIISGFQVNPDVGILGYKTSYEDQFNHYPTMNNHNLKKFNDNCNLNHHDAVVNHNTNMDNVNNSFKNSNNNSSNLNHHNLGNDNNVIPNLTIRPNTNSVNHNDQPNDNESVNNDNHSGSCMCCNEVFALASMKRFTQSQIVGSEIQYRCPKCRACHECKNCHQEISIREEVE